MNQNNNIWDYAELWKNIREPARPNTSELNWLAQYIKPKQQVLILGSTPEYRDLCTKAGAYATVVDFSESNHKSLTTLMSQSPTQEHFICQDWINVTLQPKFDLVLGDHVVNLLTWQNLPLLCRNIAQALKSPESLWITRIITLDNLPKRSIPDIIENYRKQHSNQHFFSTTAYDVFNYCLDPTEQSITLGKVWQTLHQFHEAGVLNTQEFTAYDQMGIKDSVGKGYFYSSQALEELFRQYFTIKGTAQGELHYKNQTYFYILQK